MNASNIFGFVMLGGGALCVMWRAHKDGTLIPLLKGALYGAGAAIFICTAMWLISRSGQ